MKRIMTIDAETNGLWGNVFAIGAQVWENGEKVSEIALRLPNSYVNNEWVIENVLPELDSMEITHVGYEEMLQDFATWYKENKTEETTCLWHMGHVVEAGMFRELVSLGYLGQFEAPYCPIEVAETLRVNGFKPDSVDSYAKNYNVKVNYASTHNPLYDAEIAYLVWHDLHYGKSETKNAEQPGPKENELDRSSLFNNPKG